MPVRIFPRGRNLRVAITGCLLMFQGQLLWLATSHQHSFAEFARGTSPAIHQGGVQPLALASELSCGLCQVVRQSPALPVTGSPVLYAAPFVSRLLLLRAGNYRSRQLRVPQGRAPPLCWTAYRAAIL